MSIRAGTGNVGTAGELERATGAIRDALDRYDETGAQLALQSVLTAHTPISVIRDLIIPDRRDIGNRWTAAHIAPPRNTSPQTSSSRGCSRSRAVGTTA
ncbi:MAG: hypothetical protein WAL22_09830 [Solirubrobacteraceae bacterium]